MIINQSILAAVKVEASYNTILRQYCENEGIPVMQSGPFKFGSSPAHSQRLSEISDDIWKMILPVFTNGNNRGVITEMLEDINSFDRKYAKEIKVIENEVGYNLTRLAMGDVVRFYQ